MKKLLSSIFVSSCLWAALPNVATADIITPVASGTIRDVSPFGVPDTIFTPFIAVTDDRSDQLPREQRGVAEFDLTGITSPITLATFRTIADNRLDFVGPNTIGFFTYTSTSDGVVALADWEPVDRSPVAAIAIPSQSFMVQLDVTARMEAARLAGATHFGVNFDVAEVDKGGWSFVSTEIEFTAVPPDDDGDGVVNDDDFCPDTTLTESVPTRSLGVNRFALVDGDNTFDTTSPRGKGPRRSYTTTDTAGCSCTQIIEAQSLGKGHTKFGCSISAMDNWVEFVTP